MDYPVVRNIIPQIYQENEKAYFDAKWAEKDALRMDLKKKTGDLSFLAECLYSINKEAKRQRDMQNGQADRIWGPDDLNVPKGLAHYNLHARKSQKEFLYSLKDKALRIIIANNPDIVPLGYHVFPNATENQKMDYYEIGGFGFHIDENKSENCLGEIDTLITAEKSRSIPYRKAVIAVQEYCKLYPSPVVKKAKKNKKFRKEKFENDWNLENDWK